MFADFGGEDALPGDDPVRHHDERGLRRQPRSGSSSSPMRDHGHRRGHLPHAARQGVLAPDCCSRCRILGPVMRKIAVARFTRTLGTLLAIRRADPGRDGHRRALGRQRRRREGRSTYTAEKIREGRTMAEPLMETKVFPPMVVQMIGVGEQTGALDQMLNKIADFYEEEVDVAVAALTSMLEPIMLVVIGGMVGFMLIAMYLPIFSIAGNIQARSEPRRRRTSQPPASAAQHCLLGRGGCSSPPCFSAASLIRARRGPVRRAHPERACSPWSRPPSPSSLAVAVLLPRMRRPRRLAACSWLGPRARHRPRLPPRRRGERLQLPLRRGDLGRRAVGRPPRDAAHDRRRAARLHVIARARAGQRLDPARRPAPTRIRDALDPDEPGARAPAQPGRLRPRRLARRKPGATGCGARAASSSRPTESAAELARLNEDILRSHGVGPRDQRPRRAECGSSTRPAPSCSAAASATLIGRPALLAAADAVERRRHRPGRGRGHPHRRRRASRSASTALRSCDAEGHHLGRSCSSRT